MSMLVSPTVKILSDDLEKESQKVRSMYDQGANLDWEAGAYSGIAERLEVNQSRPDSGSSQ